jgi:hypothetical protein
MTTTDGVRAADPGGQWLLERETGFEPATSTLEGSRSSD